MKKQPERIQIAKRICLLLIIVVLANMSAGCWDRVEIEKLSFTTMVGVDTAGPDGVLVTFQTVIPRMLAKGAGGGGGGGAPAKPYTNYSVQGRNVSDAVHSFELKNSNTALFRATTVIIIGEDEARKDVLPPLDFFTRKAMMRRSILVLAAKGRAEDILLKGDPGPETIPANAIRTLFQRRQDVTSNYAINFAEFLSNIERPGKDAIIPAIELVPELSGTVAGSQGGTPSPGQQKDVKEGAKQVLGISSLGVFKMNRLVDFLGTSESRGVLWVRGKAQGGTITVPADTQDTWASLLVSSESSKITPTMAPDGIRFKIEIKVNGYVSSVQDETLDLTKPENVQKLEQEEKKAITSEVMAAVQRSQELHSDFLGLGEKIYESNPNLWKQIEPDWRDQRLPKVQVDLGVSCKLRRTGLTAEPVKPR